MKRRDFIKGSLPLVTVPFFSNKIFASVVAPSVSEAALLMGTPNDKILVVVQMIGGNDGLNTVIPLDQYTNLAVARPSILIPQNKVLQLGNFQTGLHPSMTGMRDLYTQGKLSIVQNVGYANQSTSHFRATDIWLSGSSSNEIIDTGWLGRYLESEYPGFPQDYPNTAMPDPLSIRIGSTATPAFDGRAANTGQVVPLSFSGALVDLGGVLVNTTAMPNTNSGDEVKFLREEQVDASEYGQSIKNAWNRGTNMATYPEGSLMQPSQLDTQLKIVARLIKGGLKTKVYWVEITGFDTHINQEYTGGGHGRLLSKLSTAITAFQEDLRLMRLEDRVLGMTFSEFGRQIKNNSTNGTDHGTAAPMFLFGKSVNPTIIGNNPVIGSSLADGASVTMQYDYRQVYMSILRQWFCVGQTDAQTLLGNYPPLQAINSACSVVPIKMKNFDVKAAHNDNAQLNWTTASESNVSHFDIERSTDGKLFEKVGTVKAIGFSNSIQHYDFSDKNIPLSNSDIFYYRLKINDFDTTSSLSDIRSITFDKASKTLLADVYPNPVSGRKINVTLRGEVKSLLMTNINITDLYGRQVYQTPITPINTLADSVFELDLTGMNLSKGVYFLTITNGAQTVIKKLVLI